MHGDMQEFVSTLLKQIMTYHSIPYSFNILFVDNVNKYKKVILVTHHGHHMIH
jgi:hypothetical protein